MTLQADIVGARFKSVREHVRRENVRDPHAIMQTFVWDARYDDEPCSEHYEGRRAVQGSYEARYVSYPISTMTWNGDTLLKVTSSSR
jgi:hypothetical protein